MNLYCETSGHSSKQPTLFLHGNLASARWWEPALREWRKLGPQGDAEILAADWRGSGRNPDWPGDRPFTLRELAEDHLELLASRGARGPWALVGHSLGGLIAQQMMILEPGLFSRAVLLDPVGARGVVFDDSMYEAFRQMAASPELTRTVILSTIEGAAALPPEFQDAIAADAYKAVRGIGHAVLEILKRVDLSEPLGRVSVPTLILHGAKDAVIPLRDSEELARRMPNAKLEVLPAQGHCYNVENPAGFTARIRRWLGEEV